MGMVFDISIFILLAVVVAAGRLQTADRSTQRSFNINLPCGFAKRNTKWHNAATNTTKEIFDMAKCKTTCKRVQQKECCKHGKK